MLKISLLLILTCAIAIGTRVQDLLIYDVVTDNTRTPLPGAQVQVFKNMNKVVGVVADSIGKYWIQLDHHTIFELEYTFAGRVTKRIVIDGTDLPKVDTTDGGFGMNVDVQLFEPYPKVDYGFHG